jgi:5-methylthioadenosine/S-adenosylhomocysteine deaminase
MIRDQAWRSDPVLPERNEFVLRGGYIVTMDPAIGDVPAGDIHVRDGVIVAVGRLDVAPEAVSIEATDRAILPGFVDTHWHLWNSILRGVVGDGDRSYFPVKARLAPHFSAFDTYRSVRLGLAEGLAAGITTVNDWDHNVRSPEHADANALAIVDSGLRARYSYGNPDKLDPARVMDFQDVERFGRDWLGGAGDGRITLGMAMRGPVRTKRDVCLREWEFARDHGLPMTMHCSGRRDASGRDCELEAMAADGLLGPDLQVVHAVSATSLEIDLLGKSETHVSLSPLTEYRSIGIPPLGSFLDAGILVSLSIDTLATPTTADMFVQMKVALSVERARLDGASLSPRDALQLATINGARDLGLADQIGSLTPGKRADLISVRLDSLNMAPAADPISLLVYGAAPSDVELVVVDGRILKRDGLLTAHDAADIVADARNSLRDVLARADWNFPIGVAADAGGVA